MARRRYRFAKRVNHPGTKAQPFLRPAFERVKPQFIAAVAQAWAASGNNAALLNSNLSRLVRQYGFLTQRIAQQLCPVDKGRLRASINTRVNGLVATVGTNVRYARAVEFGTKPRVIVPKRAKALRWRV